MPWTNHSTHRNANWQVWQDSDGRLSSEAASRCILLDIREELRETHQAMSSILGILRCSNCLDIPHKLDKIVKNTRPKPKKKKLARQVLRG